MMRRALFGMLATAALMIGPGFALAAPIDPVRSLLDAASHNFAQRQDAVMDYFSRERLGSLYSQDFVARYKAAAALKQNGDDNVLYHDMLTYNSGGCPFKDLRIDVGPTVNGVTEIRAAFLPYT